MKAATTRKDVSMNYTDPDGPDPDEGGVPEPCKVCGKRPCVCKNPPSGG